MTRWLTCSVQRGAVVAEAIHHLKHGPRRVIRDPMRSSSIGNALVIVRTDGMRIRNHDPLISRGLRLVVSSRRGQRLGQCREIAISYAITEQLM